MKLNNIYELRKLTGPLFKRGINRKYRKRNKKKITNAIRARNYTNCWVEPKSVLSF